MSEKNQDSENKKHPVWDVYDELRTARLNVLYYESQLKTLTRLNTTIEWLLAVATSSTVAGSWLWKSEIGGYAWKALGVIAVFLAIGRPILNFTNKIKRKSETLGAYRELDHDFLNLKIKISQNRKYDSTLKKEFQTLLKKKGEIIKKYKDEYVNQKLRSRCSEQVNKELPADNFYIPKEE